MSAWQSDPAEMFLKKMVHEQKQVDNHWFKVYLQ